MIKKLAAVIVLVIIASIFAAGCTTQNTPTPTVPPLPANASVVRGAEGDTLSLGGLNVTMVNYTTASLADGVQYNIFSEFRIRGNMYYLSLIHISEPTRRTPISYA